LAPITPSHAKKNPTESEMLTGSLDPLENICKLQKILFIPADMMK
jgi:hypothetical protein